MTGRVRLYPYKMGSASAKDLGIMRIRKEGSRFRARPGDIVINWGCTAIPNYNCTVVNSGEAVSLASSKADCLQALSANDVPTVPFTTDRQRAVDMLPDSRGVYCRTLTRSHSGKGIVIATTPDEVVPAPLYTQYVRRRDEYRVHVIFGEVVDVQRKMRRHDVPDEAVDWSIRNHANGFIYGREGLIEERVDTMSAIALDAIDVLGLDFGAVDIIHSIDDEYLVLEVNTAPGLTGTTLDKYKEKINESTTITQL